MAWDVPLTVNKDQQRPSLWKISFFLEPPRNALTIEFRRKYCISIPHIYPYLVENHRNKHQVPVDLGKNTKQPLSFFWTASLFWAGALHAAAIGDLGGSLGEPSKNWSKNIPIEPWNEDLFFVAKKKDEISPIKIQAQGPWFCLVFNLRRDYQSVDALAIEIVVSFKSPVIPSSWFCKNFRL